MPGPTVRIAGLVLLALLPTVLVVSAAPAEYPFLQCLTCSGGDCLATGWWGVAVNGSGYIHVCQYSANTIEIFSPSLEWCGRHGSVPTPTGIAVNSTGYLFVADFGQKKLLVLNPSGERIREVGYTAGYPYGVAVNSSDFVFVTLSSYPKVQVHDRDGRRVEEFVSGVNPWTIAVNGTDHILIAVRNSRTVSVFDPAYRAVSPIDSGFVNGVEGLAIDRADNVIVAGFEEVGSTDFRVFSPDGTLIGGSSERQVRHPRGIAVTPTGRV
ncbi:MAG TPA: hypothetical protein PLI31_09735, partial [Methanoregulaceae archaeon]|nr:hypothetical protein [Methanoregulaceae archaeon]